MSVTLMPSNLQQALAELSAEVDALCRDVRARRARQTRSTFTRNRLLPEALPPEPQVEIVPPIASDPASTFVTPLPSPLPESSVQPQAPEVELSPPPRPERHKPEDIVALGDPWVRPTSTRLNEQGLFGRGSKHADPGAMNDYLSSNGSTSQIEQDCSMRRFTRWLFKPLGLFK